MLRAYDYDGDEVTLVHADDVRLRRMAVFDVLINNADRKGGHILSGVYGHVYGVDHGVSMHVEDKLRTVLWGWSGKPVDELKQAREDGIPAGRFGTAEEFGDYCAYLCSAQASYITGQNLLIDGGNYPGTF